MIELGMTGTSLLCLLAFMVLGCIGCTLDAIRIRRKAQGLLAEARAHEKDARILYEAAREVYRDAAARWSYVVQLEGRVH